MSLEAIQEITQAEQESREKLAAAEAEAKALTANAERDGQVLLLETRAEAAKKGKRLMEEAAEFIVGRVVKR